MQRFSAIEVLAQLDDSETDVDESVSETEDNVEGDPDFEASTSDDNETLVISQAPADSSCLIDLRECTLSHLNTKKDPSNACSEQRGIRHLSHKLG